MVLMAHHIPSQQTPESTGTLLFCEKSSQAELSGRCGSGISGMILMIAAQPVQVDSSPHRTSKPLFDNAPPHFSAYLSTCESVIQQHGRDSLTGARFDSDPGLPARLTVAATAPGVPMMTGWSTREPTTRSQYRDETRTIMAQTQFSHMFYLNCDDDVIARHNESVQTSASLR